jgi:hypothetical protein
MEKFWKAALTFGGISAIGAFLFWSLYKEWLSLGIFSQLSPEHTYEIMKLFLLLTFFSLLAILFIHISSNKRKMREKVKRLENNVTKNKPKIPNIRTLENETHLDLLDNSGNTAILTAHQLYESEQNNVFEIIEPLQTDGFIDSFEVSPGNIESVYKKEGIYYVKSSFNKPLSKGEKTRRTFRCIFHNSFSGESQYWSRREGLPIDKFKIVIYFPLDRVYKGFAGYKQCLSYEDLYDVQPNEVTIEGRKCLSWELANLEDNRQRSYRLDWCW